MNDLPVTKDYVFKDLDLLSHKIHRHEMPILDLPVTIIHEDDDLLVVNKPPSMPAHPCGLYGFNSLLTILAKEMNYSKVRLVHRLDRVTSGIMIFTKNYDKAAEISSLVKSRNVEKYYLCSVEGNYLSEFQHDLQVVDKPLGSLCPKMGLQWVDEVNGKPAFTVFRGLSYSAKLNETLVLCRIYTGRTHQIRIHLQYLGYPIKDDPIYNSTAWGPDKGRHSNYTQPKEKLIDNITQERSRDIYYTTFSNTENVHLSNEPQVKIAKKEYYSENCEICNQINETADPPVRNLILRLHSYHYKLPDNEFSATSLPPWCSSFIEDANGEKNLISTVSAIIQNEFKIIKYSESDEDASSIQDDL